jgi:outer membrane lipoprotein-sorting protein
MEIVVRMVRAEGLVSLEGEQEIVYFRPGDDEKHTVREEVYLKAPHRKRTETLDSESRHGHLTVCDGKTRTAYFPRRKMVFQTPLPAKSRIEEIKCLRVRLLKANFAATLQRTQQIAGRKAYAVELRPKRFEGSVHRFWIDAGTYVRLKEEQLGADGRLLGSTQFVRVSFSKPVPDSLFDFSPPADAQCRGVERNELPPLSLKELDRQAPFRVVAPPTLPGGFVFESARLQQHGDRRVAWMRYIDGLNFLSLFETPVVEEQRPRALGKPRFFRRDALMWNTDGINFVLVGGVPRPQMEAIRAELAK